MLKKSLLFALVLVAVSSTAWAQTKVQVSFLFGYTVSDGVSGDPFTAANGKIYDRLDPKDGGNAGFQVGFMVNPKAEIGFMYRRQMSTIQVSGPTETKDIGDVKIDGYHGYFAYYFGDPEARVNPYFLLGLGATYIPKGTYTTTSGASFDKPGASEFSSTWGAGVQINAAKHFAVKTGVSWTPTYIKSDATGWWCDPYWGCYVVGNAQYMNQFHFEGAFVIRF